MTRFAAPIAEQIWGHEVPDEGFRGQAVDGSVEDSWRRVARDLARVESDPAKWEDKFYSALEDFKYLPAGRILAGAERAGRSRCSTASSWAPSRQHGRHLRHDEGGCADHAAGRRHRLRLQHDPPAGRGGQGRGGRCVGSAVLHDVWDAMCRTIMSAGSRRGAMMATMRCDHPDVEQFIVAKQDSARLRMFNLSVLITDDFMDAVRADAPWDLKFEGRVYSTVQALDLWNRIMKATYDFAEPGVIFIDGSTRQQPVLCRDDRGHQPLRRAAPAALWRLPAGLDQPGPAGQESVHRDGRTGPRRPGRSGPHGRPDDGQRGRRIEISAGRAGRGSPQQASHRPGRTGLADALLMLGLRYGRR